MSLRVLVLGANGALGTHVVRQALASGHQVTALVRNPAKLAADVRDRVTVHVADISQASQAALAEAIRGHDALVNTAGFVTENERFIALFDQVVSAAESLPPNERPVCWLTAGAALLELDANGRRGVDLPRLRHVYWPHARNLERLQRSTLDWRLLCPGPMVESDPVGAQRMRVSQEKLPVTMPGVAAYLPGVLALLLFAKRMPQMIISYADAAQLMVNHLAPGGAMARRRVGLALPAGMRGSKKQWQARSPAGA